MKPQDGVILMIDLINIKAYHLQHVKTYIGINASNGSLKKHKDTSERRKHLSSPYISISRAAERVLLILPSLFMCVTQHHAPFRHAPCTRKLNFTALNCFWQVAHQYE